MYRSSICTYMYAICVKCGMHSYKFPGAVFLNNFPPVLVHTWSRGQATSKYSIQTRGGAFISEIWIHYHIHVHSFTYMYSHTHTHTHTYLHNKPAQLHVIYKCKLMYIHSSTSARSTSSRLCHETTSDERR